MEDSRPNTVVVNGKQFEFVRITPHSQAKISKKSTLSAKDALGFKLALKNALHQSDNSKPGLNAFETAMLNRLNNSQPIRDWQKTRSVAFKRGFIWKYFKIVPRALWCKNVDLTQSGEIQADFFDYLQAKGDEYKKHLSSVKNTLTKSNE